MSLTLDQVRISLTTCQAVFEKYQTLLDSYVSDFYVDHHWNQLPESWKKFFESSDIKTLELLLDVSKTFPDKVLPLSLIVLRSLNNTHSIPRQQVPNKNFGHSPAFSNQFWKNVKAKKRHEITIMSNICKESALKTNCLRIVDVGAGLGHLSRMLAHLHDLKVCSLEKENVLVEQAQEMDQQFNKLLGSHKQIVHVTYTVKKDVSVKDFLLAIKDFASSGEPFGIVGLHPCGDLAASLLKLYNTCPQIVFINIASCCYMKLSLGLTFPLSDFSSKQNIYLTYLSCEIACHAIENYISKLRTCPINNLKVHSYRAALELLLIEKNPKLKHSQIASSKCTNDMSFRDYCQQALRKQDITLNLDQIVKVSHLVSNTWMQVIVFYSLRLLLAPMVETIILYDRFLYLKEGASECCIIPAFDPSISPRSHIICACKSV